MTDRVPVPQVRITNLKAVLLKADPRLAVDSKREPEYKLPNGEVKVANTSQRGPYAGD